MVMRRATQWGAVLALLAFALGCTGPGQPRVVGERRLVVDTRGQRELNLLAMGDWGRNSDAQRRVAAGMARHVNGSRQGFHGVLLAGDNFYVKLQGVEDPTIQTVFERMYDSSALGFPFYAAPGNHDYEGGKLQIELDYARLNPESRWKMPANYYRIDFRNRADVLATVLMLDSEKDLMGELAWQDQLDWLREQLASATASEWKIVVAHRPLFSNGDHGDNGVLQSNWGPLFNRYGVDLYVCGHDHDLQHLQIESWTCSFVLVGGGGARVRPMRVDRRGPFSKSMHGFGHISLDSSSLNVTLLDHDGVAVHAFRRAPDGSVRVLQTQNSDVAVPRTPKSINRPDLDVTTTGPATRVVE